MGYIFRTVGGGHDDWVDAECLALRGCDPPLREGDQLVLPTRKIMRPTGNRSMMTSTKKRERIPLFQRLREERYGKVS